MKLGYLVKGLPGHPLHPPLTDATIGIYTGAKGLSVSRRRRRRPPQSPPTRSETAAA
jgi:hypothetical protein